MAQKTLSDTEIATRLPSQDEMSFVRDLVADPSAISGGATTAAMDLYIDASGDDSAGDGSLTSPYRQIQTAIDTLPKLIRHNVTIHVGAGEFAGFLVSGFVPHEGATLSVNGVAPSASTLTGEQTGDADSGTALVMEYSAGNWGSDDLTGKLLKVGSNYRTIKSNTATQITMANSFPGAIGTGTFEIVEQTTKITSAESKWFGIGNIAILNNSVGYRYNMNVQDLWIDSSTTTCIFLYESCGVKFERIRAEGSVSVGLSLQGVRSEFDLKEIYLDATNVSTTGINCLHSTGWLRNCRVMIDGAAPTGVSFQNQKFVENADICVVGCGTGVWCGLGYAELWINRLDADGCTSTGCRIKAATVYFNGACTGTGTGAHGMTLGANADVLFVLEPDITGATGDFKFDDDDTVLTWSEEVAASGEGVQVLAQFSRVIRT